MSFLNTIPYDSAEGDLAVIYAGEWERMGYLPNYTRIFSLHPEAFRAWRSLAGALIGEMDERRYELATLGAARQLRSSYCSLAHGKILRDKFHDADQIRRIAEDPASSDLDEVDQAIIEFAGKVAADAASIAAVDIHRLRSLGLDDKDIFDVVLAAAARCFFSKVLDATGTLPDRAFRDLEPELREALTVGRPIEDG